MRRFSVVLVAALVFGAALMLIFSPSGSVSPFRLAQLGVQSIDLGARIVPLVTRALSATLCASVPPASAQEVLEFKELPPESVSRLERRNRRRIEISTPEAPAAPSPPSIPEISKTGDLMRIGSDVHIEADQVVAGNLLAVGGDITIDGHVEGDVVAMGGDVQLNATARVDGDVASVGGTLTEEPGASVGGQRVTASGVRGMKKLKGRVRDSIEDETHRGVASAGRIASSMIWLLIMLGVAWGFTQIAPGRTGTGVQTLRRETAMSVGIGALIWALIIPSLVALCLVVAILCITIIGIPVALAALLGYGLFLVLLWVWGYVISAAAVGEWVLRRRAARAARMSGAVPADLGGAMPALAEPSLARKAMTGVLILSGTGFVGEFLKAIPFMPPLHGFGTFLAVVSTVAGALAATFGAGAWLRTEFVSGTLKRWWAGRRTSTTAASSVTPTGVVEAVAPPPPPQV